MNKYIDFSEGWQLGWMPETVLGRWKQRFGDWAVTDGVLWGENPYFAQIFTSIEPADPYFFEGTVCIDGPDTAASVMVCLSEERNTYYQLFLKPGMQPVVNYIMADAKEGELLPPAGPEIQAGTEYTVRFEVLADHTEAFIDGVSLGTFCDKRLAGRMAGFAAHGGRAHFKHARLLDAASGEVLFEDDFSENTLKRVVPVALEELKCAQWIPAVVPGTVHTSLLEAGIIEDPYYGYNGPKQKWVDQQRWVYKKTFRVPEEAQDAPNLELVFEGIDYHGYVWFNGDLLGYHEGTLLPNRFDITSKVRRKGDNEVVVCILPCPFPPHANIKPYITERWHFNMDIVTAGLWRPVTLRAFGKASLRDVQVITRSIGDDAATLDVSFTINNWAMYPFEMDYTVKIASPDGDEVAEQSSKVGYFHGAQRQSVCFEISNPRLWWPNGMGEQPLYTLEVKASCRESGWANAITSTETKTLQFGIRIIEKRPTPDKQWKYNWVFVVNGRPFFAKGGNWMPIDQMLRLDPQHYERLLTRAKDSHVNMLRPWGAGLLETDEFYACCDRLGICVWQEFPLANGLFHKMDREVWRETIVSNVKRLRNHPSLFVWCGGNEFDPDCPLNKPVVDELEYLCQEFDPTRDFHRACPYGGDSHSYQVNWMEGANYTYFTRDLSAGVTEFSMASPPMMESLLRMMPEEEFEQFPPKGPDPLEAFPWKGWEPSFREAESGFSMHDAHLSRALMVMMPFISESGIPSNWDEFIRYAQNSHGLLTKFGVDFWRSRWPNCTCALSWVFNVIWPSSLTWEYVDWFNVPKMSYYDQKCSFEPLHVGAVYDDMFTPAGEEFRAKLFVANEHMQSYPNAVLAVRLRDVLMKLLSEATKAVDAPADAVCAGGFFTWRIPSDMKDAVLFLTVDLLESPGGALLSRSVYTPRVGARSMRMPYLEHGPWICDVEKTRTALAFEWAQPWREDAEGFAAEVVIRNTGEIPAYRVSLASPGHDHIMRYEDNGFWLEPGEARTLWVKAWETPPAHMAVSAWNAEKLAVPKTIE